MTICDEPSEPPPYRSNPSHVKARRHDEYYFDDGNLVIQVGNSLFRVWDGVFRRHSKFFPGLSRSVTDKTLEGADDEHPLHLEGIESADFERLLWIIYPPIIGQLKAQTSQEWISILDLSTRWKFNDIRELAIKELAALDLDPVDKIELGQKYEIKRQWAYTSYIALCSRPHALDVIEGRQLGIETTVNIAFAREKLEKGGRGKPNEVKKIVCDIFELQAI